MDSELIIGSSLTKTVVKCTWFGVVFGSNLVAKLVPLIPTVTGCVKTNLGRASGVTHADCWRQIDLRLGREASCSRKAPVTEAKVRGMLNSSNSFKAATCFNPSSVTRVLNKKENFFKFWSRSIRSNRLFWMKPNTCNSFSWVNCCLDS